VPLACGEQHGQRTAVAVAGQMQLGRQPTAAATKGLIAVGIGAYVGTRYSATASAVPFSSS
jgi:hypothetical protein